MIIRNAATTLLFAMACALPPASFAAEPAAEPQMNTGYTNRSPRTPTVSETEDQITATQAIGAEVRDATGAVVAKISDLMADRNNGAIALAILNPAGGGTSKNTGAAVAWGSLRFEGKPTPHFVTELSREALASGTSVKDQVDAKRNYYDVERELLGKTAIGADGADLGHIKDVVLTFGDGRPVALVIDTGGLISVGAKDHAMAWDKAKPEIGEGNSPVHLAVSKPEVEAAPVKTTQAPRPAPTETGNTAPVISRDSAGNISGTKVPAPPTRRQ